jgi:hypothetical protein
LLVGFDSHVSDSVIMESSETSINY